MKQGIQKAESASEYPYIPMYRPWSWVLSSLSNLFIFAALLGIAYFYYRTRKARHQRRTVTYRTVQVPKKAQRQDERLVALVTGGNGRLGGEIIGALVAEDKYAIHSLDIFLPDEENRIEGVDTYIQADITNPDDLSIAFRGVDVVFHCASLTPVSVRYSKEDYYLVNVTGTENVIAACKECGVKRLIYTSTASVTLSNNPSEVCINCDESYPLPTDPLNAYVGSKGKADSLIRATNNASDGLLTCVLRPNVFVETLCLAIEKNLYYLGEGNFEVSLVSVHSAAQAHVLAEKKLLEGKAAPGKAYNVSDQKVTMKEFTEFVASVMNDSPMAIPLRLIKGLAYLNELVYRWTGMVLINEALSVMNVNMKTHTYSCELAKKELGWGQSPPWKEVVRDLLKKRKESKKVN